MERNTLAEKFFKKVDAYNHPTCGTIKIWNILTGETDMLCLLIDKIGSRKNIPLSQIWSLPVVAPLWSVTVARWIKKLFLRPSCNWGVVCESVTPHNPVTLWTGISTVQHSNVNNFPLLFFLEIEAISKLGKLQLPCGQTKTSTSFKGHLEGC